MQLGVVLNEFDDVTVQVMVSAVGGGRPRLIAESFRNLAGQVVTKHALLWQILSTLGAGLAGLTACQVLVIILRQRATGARLGLGVSLLVDVIEQRDGLVPGNNQVWSLSSFKVCQV